MKTSIKQSLLNISNTGGVDSLKQQVKDLYSLKKPEKASFYSRLATFLGSSLLFLAASPLMAANFVVTNNNGDPALDNGVCNSNCSLREAINASNATPGPNTITFKLNNPVIILKTSLLPIITNTVAIDGNNKVYPYRKVLLEGSQLPQDDPNVDCLSGSMQSGAYYISEISAVSGMLFIQGPGGNGSIIKNLDFRVSVNSSAAIKNVPYDALDIQYYGQGSALVSQLYGVRAAANIVLRGPCTGVTIMNSDFNRVENSMFTGFIVGNASINIFGSSNSIMNNVISGDVNDGIETDRGANNLIEGNIVLGKLMNESEGISAFKATSNTIIRGNIISNFTNNITLGDGSSAGIAERNYIGLGDNGIMIGGCGGGSQGNIVRSNMITDIQTGIAVSRVDFPDYGCNVGDYSTVNKNTLSQNSIFNLTTNGNEANLFLTESATIPGIDPVWVAGVDIQTFPIGIDLGRAAFFVWPWADGIGAPPAFTQAPTIASAKSVDDGYSISGSLSDANKPNTTYRVELFANVSNQLESQFYLGAKNVTTNGSGQAQFTANLDDNQNHCLGRVKYVTATATALNGVNAGGTSELSQPVKIKNN